MCGKQHLSSSPCQATDIGRETKSTRKSVSAGTIRYRQLLLRSWSKDQTVIAMSSGEAGLYAACRPRERKKYGSRVDSASRCHGTASGCQGCWNIGWQGLEKVRHPELSYLWLQAAVQGKHVTLEKVQSESNEKVHRDEGDREGHT